MTVLLRPSALGCCGLRPWRWTQIEAAEGRFFLPPRRRVTEKTGERATGGVGEWGSQVKHRGLEH